MDPTDALQSLHYFFSTAPQVLGAILAISGAFVVFKLDSLKKFVFSESQRLIDIGKPSERKPKNEKYDLKKMIEENSKRGVFMRHIEKEYEKIKYSQIANNYKELKEIISEVKSDIEDTHMKLKKETEKIGAPLYEEPYFKFVDICNAILDSVKIIDRFVLKTYACYIGNGILLLSLILAFNIIPLYYNNCYTNLMIAGSIVTTISLIWIVYYLLSSLSLGMITAKRKVPNDQP